MRRGPLLRYNELVTPPTDTMGDNWLATVVPQLLAQPNVTVLITWDEGTLSSTPSEHVVALEAGAGVPSDAQLTATVPTGAATGPIAVTTSGGTGVSQASFSVHGHHQRTSIHACRLDALHHSHVRSDHVIPSGAGGQRRMGVSGPWPSGHD